MANNYINVGTATAAAGTSTLYTAGSGTAVVGSLTVGNSAGTARTFSLYLGTKWTHSSVAIPPYDSYEKSGIVLQAGQTLQVIGSNTDVEFVFMGVEIS